MRFIFFQRQFTISFFLFVLVIIACVVMLRLGIWQLQRAADKTELLNSLARADSAAIQHVKQLPENILDWQYQKVKLDGRYLAEKQILLDNQFNGDIDDKRAGYDGA